MTGYLTSDFLNTFDNLRHQRSPSFSDTLICCNSCGAWWAKRGAIHPGTHIPIECTALLNKWKIGGEILEPDVLNAQSEHERAEITERLRQKLNAK